METDFLSQLTKLGFRPKKKKTLDQFTAQELSELYAYMFSIIDPNLKWDAKSLDLADNLITIIGNLQLLQISVPPRLRDKTESEICDFLVTSAPAVLRKLQEHQAKKKAKNDENDHPNIVSTYVVPKTNVAVPLKTREIPRTPVGPARMVSRTDSPHALLSQDSPALKFVNPFANRQEIPRTPTATQPTPLDAEPEEDTDSPVFTFRTRQAKKEPEHKNSNQKTRTPEKRNPKRKVVVNSSSEEDEKPSKNSRTEPDTEEDPQSTTGAQSREARAFKKLLADIRRCQTEECAVLAGTLKRGLNLERLNTIPNSKELSLALTRSAFIMDVVNKSKCTTWEDFIDAVESSSSFGTSKTITKAKWQDVISAYLLKATAPC